MTPERFAQLAQAYGADIGRWPEGEREAARRLASADAPPGGDLGAPGGVLEAEAALDHLLWRATTPSASLDLSDRVIALAPRPRAAARPLTGWLTGIGVAAGLACACAAGVGLGVVLAPHALNGLFAPAHAAPPGEEAAAGESLGVDSGAGGDIG
jgi:hypothetical protein